MLSNFAGNEIAEDVAKSELMVVCEVCGKSISRLDYERHLRTHKEKRVEICKICLKPFTSEYLLTSDSSHRLNVSISFRYFQFQVSHGSSWNRSTLAVQ